MTKRGTAICPQFCAGFNELLSVSSAQISASCRQQISPFGFGHSDLIRVSDFGFRIWHADYHGDGIHFQRTLDR
jgi:hypothetical protein